MINAIAITVGTNIFAILSAKRLIGICLLWAVFKREMIFDKVVSDDFFKTSTVITAFVFTVPESTSSYNFV